MDIPVPKVSVIMPAFQHAEWVAEALESVFSQSLQSWELIIIDDASQDNTHELIQQTVDAWKSSQERSNSIHIIRHSSNQGAPATLNEGLAMARGQFLAVLNSDDVWHEQRLERLFLLAQQDGLDFVGTSVSLWDKNSRLKNASETHWLERYRELYADWKKQGDFLHTLLMGNFLITTSNFFWRRSWYDKIGGFAELRYVHDYEYLFKLFNAGAKMDCLWEESLLNYRLHDSNTIREKPLAAIRENISLLLEQFPKLSQHLNASRLHALQSQLFRLDKYLNEEWATEVHHQLVVKEEELFPLVKDREAWIAERDAVIGEQKKHLQERDSWIAERDGWVAERDDIIRKLQEDIVRQQGWIAERESWLSDRDEMISKRDQWVAERDHWIAERDGWIQERDEAIEALRTERSAVHGSWAFRFAWFVLNPLRGMKRLFRGGKWGAGHA